MYKIDLAKSLAEMNGKNCSPDPTFPPPPTKKMGSSFARAPPIKHKLRKNLVQLQKKVG